MTDQTEATSFVAELLKSGNCAQHITVLYERQKFSKPKSSTHDESIRIYVSLIVYFKDEVNILGVAIDVLDIFQLSDVYQMKMYA